MIFFIDSIVYICSKALGVKNDLYQFFYLIVSSKDIDSDVNYISKMVFVKYVIPLLKLNGLIMWKDFPKVKLKIFV